MQLSKCYNCMKDFDIEIDNICPHCGYYQQQQDQDDDINGIALKPGTMLHDYYIGRVLGVGGFAITYIAYDNTRRCKVAIKEYFPKKWAKREDGSNIVQCRNVDASQQFLMGLEQFEKEFHQLALVGTHRGIVNIFEAFAENDTEYISMEFIDGISLEDYLKENGPMRYDEVLKIIVPICESLDIIHKKDKIIHRDIAPDNIMLQTNGKAKLIDFGASLTDEQINKNIILKHGYAPIEQYDVDDRCSARTDIYAISAVIYHLLTGKRPISSDKRKEAIDNGEKDPLIPLSELDCVLPDNPEEAKKIEDIIMRGLNIIPDDRIQSADELAQLLSEFMPKASVPVVLKKNFPGKILKIVIPALIVTVAAIVLLLVSFLNPKEESNDDYLKIPNVCGLTLDEAEDKASQFTDKYNVRLSVRQKDFVESNDKNQVGTVANQEPKAGSKVLDEDESKETLVVIFVNLYEYDANAENSDDKKIQMPNLINKTEKDAKALLKKSNLNNYTVKYEHDTNVKKGLVFKQSQKAKKDIKSDTKIVIYVSTGPENTTAPPITVSPTIPRTSSSTAIYSEYSEKTSPPATAAEKDPPEIVGNAGDYEEFDNEEVDDDFEELF